MYVKLIQPKMIKRPMDTGIKIHMAPPLGLLTLVNILRNDHRVSLENENTGKINYDDNPDIVGITVTVDTYPRAVEIAKRFREKGIKVVAGGIHITSAYESIPDDDFDALCIGAAEVTWPEIMKDASEGKLKKIYRCPRPLRAEDIVSPAYDFVNAGEYLYCNVVHTGRGCPFKCDFCYNSCKEHAYVNRNIEDVLKDIEAVGRKHIMFIDDNFNGNPARTREFLYAIKPLNIKWNAAVSINTAYDTDLLDLMKECGCQSLFIGIESISPDSISGVHKVQNHTENYELAIKNLHDRGIGVHGSFVFGLDGDTTETFKATLDWIVKNKIESMTAHILTPYPGTETYKKMKEEGRIITDDLSLYNTANIVYKPLGMTPEELYDGYIKMYKDVYSFKNIIKRLPDKKEEWCWYLMFNFVYRKFGKMTDFICRLVSYKFVGFIAEKIVFARPFSKHVRSRKGIHENIHDTIYEQRTLTKKIV